MYVQGCDGCETTMNCARHGQFARAKEAKARQMTAYNEGYDAGQAIGLVYVSHGTMATHRPDMDPVGMQKRTDLQEQYEENTVDYVAGYQAGYRSAWEPS